MKECDALKVLSGYRNEYDGNMFTALWPFSYPKIENDRPAKCILALTLQTGRLVEKYRDIISKYKFTIPEFCNLGETQIHSPLSKIIHDEALPKSCFDIKVFKETLKHHPQLHNYFSQGTRRYDIAKAFLEMIQARFEHQEEDENFRGLGM